MNYLVAKTKGRKGAFFKVLSNKEIFTLPTDLNSNTPYETDYNLDEDEWFSVEDFSTTEYFPQFLSQKFISTNYHQLSVKDYSNLDYLCSYQSEVYYFQKVSPKHLIRKKYLSIATTPKLIENEPIIVINSTPDAIYDKDADILYFKSLTTIMGIFKGIDVLYREATKSETEDFLKSDFITLANDYNVEKVKTANRKRIALAMETLKSFTPKEKKSMFNYIQDYRKDLKFDKKTSAFEINNEEELKNLIYGIEERYYTTKFGKEKRLANSVKPIS